MTDLREKLTISQDAFDIINKTLTDPNNTLINQLMDLVESYGGPEAINQKAKEDVFKLSNHKDPMLHVNHTAEYLKAELGYQLTRI